MAVPFGDIYNDPWDGAETFDRDTVFENADTAKLCYQHAELIGAITSAENRDDGLHITARIADTQLGLIAAHYDPLEIITGTEYLDGYHAWGEVRVEPSLDEV